MGLFSGLEKFGIKTDNLTSVYEDKEQKAKAEAAEKAAKEAEEFKEENCLFAKTYECPVCDGKFSFLSVKSSKLRSVGQADDLRPLYKDFEPLKYDAVVCPSCGYGATSKFFQACMPTHRKRLRAGVQTNFHGIHVSTDKVDYDEALDRYKLALLSDVVADVKPSRKAYTCLKMKWLISSRLESEKDTMSPEKIAACIEDEKECIENAYQGFAQAYSSESFPICGMDEITLSYLLASLAFKLGNYQDALKYVTPIITNRNISNRIKDKALVLKDNIREHRDNPELDIVKKDVNVLFADTDEEILKEIDSSLSTKYNLTIVNNATDAVKIIKAKAPDIIFYEFNMPNVPGSKMYQVIKMLPNTKDTQIVLTTNSISAPELANFHDRSDVTIIAKPFSMDSLSALIEALK